jgi:predicted MPP superfamily phosphohydrolase
MPTAVSTLARLAGVTAAAGAACVGYGILVERDWYRLRRERVEALGPGQSPLTVLHLSDLHMTAADTPRVAWSGSPLNRSTCWC